MSLNRYYKEKDYVEALLKKRSFDVGAKGDLKVLAKYYKDQGKTYKEIEALLYEFANTKGKKWFKKAVHFKLIDSAVNITRRKDNVIVQIESIGIHKKELEYIDSLPYSYVEKKILFAMLVINKLKQERTKLKGLEVDYDVNYFGGGSFSYKTMLDSLQEKLTRTFCEKEIHKIIKKFNDDNIIRTTKTTSLELMFIKNIKYNGENTAMLSVSNFDNIGLYYDFIYIPEKVKMCVECNLELVKITNGNKKYCPTCQKEIKKRQDRLADNRYKEKKRES